MATIRAIIARWTKVRPPEGVVFTGSIRFSEDTQEHVKRVLRAL